jgi:hypothetical protein
MVLTNPAPITPVNAQNQLTFKQIQTENYDLARSQKNVQDFSLSVTQALNFTAISIATQPTQTAYAVPTSATPVILQFPDASMDTVRALSSVSGSYPLASGMGTYRVPSEGGYQGFLNCYFTSVATTTIFTILLVSNLQGNLAIAKQAVLSDATVALNIASPLNLSTNEQLTFVLFGDVAGTANLDPISRISVSRLR